MNVRPTEDGRPASVSFEPPGFVDVDGTITTGGEGASNVILALSPNGKRLAAKVSGAVGMDAKVVRFSRRVDDPSLLAGYVLKGVLEQAQIRVSGEVKAGHSSAPAIVRHTSEPLAALLFPVGKASNNFYAEMIFKTLGGETKGRPARSRDGGAAVTAWIEKNGAGDPGVVIRNGSGLFDSNRVTASTTARLLRAVHRDPAISAEFVSQLAIGGVDGTLHKRFREERLRRAVRAKTGTLDDAIALSGYVFGPSGKGPVAFSILMNHVSGKAGAARVMADKLVHAISEKQWSR
jgi:D-alanyl-D-alanine carboxypeptidase/D-alanyl-D-alanine-endopeptidase (penicillin-binding protein 4)